MEWVRSQQHMSCMSENWNIYISVPQKGRRVAGYIHSNNFRYSKEPLQWMEGPKAGSGSKPLIVLVAFGCNNNQNEVEVEVPRNHKRENKGILLNWNWKWFWICHCCMWRKLHCTHCTLKYGHCSVLSVISYYSSLFATHKEAIHQHRGTILLPSLSLCVYTIWLCASVSGISVPKWYKTRRYYILM